MHDSAISRGTVLGFDFGFRRIGVAVGQTTTATASGIETVAHHKTPDWVAIDRLVKEWKPNMFLVGLPLGTEGEETDMSRAARRFGNALRERFDVKCAYADERLSSMAAQDHFKQGRASGNLRRKDIERLDAMAAQIILENWLQSLPET
jgi:putative Holliday junction resolvase